MKASVKGLVERFGSKPYGWPTNAVLCLAASLCAKGRIEARSDGTALEGAGLARGLQNSHILGNILLTPQVEFTAGQIRKAKDLYKELFDRPADNGDARALGAAWGKDLATLAAEVDRLRSQRSDYPFVAALDRLVDLLRGINDKPASWFITDLPAHEDALLDAKEKALDPIRRFMSGVAKAIYDDVRAFLRAQDANFPYVGEAEANRMRAVLADPACFQGQAIQQLKAALHDLKAAVELKVLEERQALIAAVDDCAARLKQVFEFQALPEDARAEVLRRLDTHKAELNGITSIALLRDRARGAQTQLLPDMLSQVARLTPVPAAIPGMAEDAAPAPPPPEYIAAAELRVPWPGAYLAQEQDALLAALASAVLPAAALAGSDDVAVEAPWARASIGTSRPGAAYMTIRNKGEEAVTLTAIETPIAGMAEIHRTETTPEGMATMAPAGAIAIAPGEAARLEPGGLNAMLMHLTAPMTEGGSFELVLRFEDGGTVPVEGPVLGIAARGPSG